MIKIVIKTDKWKNSLEININAEYLKNPYIALYDNGEEIFSIGETLSTDELLEKLKKMTKKIDIERLKQELKWKAND